MGWFVMCRGPRCAVVPGALSAQVAIVGLVLLGAVAVARAAPPPGSAPPSSTEPVPVVSHPVSQPPPASSQPSAPPQASAAQGRGVLYGAHLFVPVLLSPDLGLDPGLGFLLRIGWEFPSGASFELGYGYFWAGGSVPDGVDTADVDLRGQRIDAAFRFAFLNPTALVPLVGAVASLSYWGFSGVPAELEGEGDGSGAITVGGLVGFVYELSPHLGVEAGLQVNYTFEGEVAYFAGQGAPLWLAPFAGVSLYY